MGFVAARMERQPDEAVKAVMDQVAEQVAAYCREKPGDRIPNIVAFFADAATNYGGK